MELVRHVSKDGKAAADQHVYVMLVLARRCEWVAWHKGSMARPIRYMCTM